MTLICVLLPTATLGFDGVKAMETKVAELTWKELVEAEKLR